MCAHRLFNRLSFANQAADAYDPVVRMIDAAIRRETLPACREDRDVGAVQVPGPRRQGGGETVSFDI